MARGRVPLLVADPERRRRGYVAVVLVIVAGALAVLPVFFFRPPARMGPTVLLLTATDTITATPANVSVNADFGPFCSQFAWDPQRRILAVQADVDLSGAEAILVNQYRQGTMNFNTSGGDLVRPMVQVHGGTWLIVSAIDGRALATLVASADNVTVNGSSYGRGAQVPLRFAYDVTADGGTAHVVEELTLRNEGLVETRIVPVEPCI